MAGEDRRSPTAVASRADGAATVATAASQAPVGDAAPALSPEAARLFERLAAEPTAFGFVSAVRQIEAAFPRSPRLGESIRPSADPVRLGQEPSVAFATSTLAQFVPPRDGKPAVLRQNAFGLTGPNGPLPLHLSEYARDRLRHHRDPTISRFFDVFHHRMTSLFYRACTVANPAISFDRPREDRFRLYIGATLGLGEPALLDRDAMPDLAKLHFAGRFSAPTKNAEGLRGVLMGFFGLPVVIEQFVGHWMTLPASAQLRLGESPETGGLGTTAIVGSRIWDVQQKFRIRFGPLSLKQYETLLPGGEGLRQLVAAVRNYIGDELIWDVNLVLRRDQAPPLRLGGDARLGLTTWLGGPPADHDPDDLYLNPHGADRAA